MTTFAITPKGQVGALGFDAIRVHIYSKLKSFALPR
jgi:hypothetical protein